MTIQCKIGPVTIDRAYDIDGYEPDDHGTEKFTVKCSKEQAVQLQGLTSTIIKNEDTGTVSGGEGWGLIPVDAATDIIDNMDILPRGYYLVKSAKPNVSTNPFKPRVDLECEKISSNLADVLEMDYSTGILDGTVLDNSYPKNDKKYYLNDTFDSLNTSIWDTIHSYMMSGASITTDGSGNLTLTGGASTLNIWGTLWMQTKTVFQTPFTIETDMSWFSRPVTGRAEHQLVLFISPTKFLDGTIQNWKNTLRVDMTVSSGNTTYVVRTINSNGEWTTLVPRTENEAVPLTWKLDFDESGNVTIYLNSGSGYTQIYTGSSNITAKDLYLGFAYETADTTVHTIKSSFVQVYEYEENVLLNVVALPANAVLEESADFNRVGADGNIPCCVNPTGPKRFYTTIDNFFKGSVKGWNSNNASGTAYQLCNLNEVLTPAKFTLDNTLIKLEFTTNSVKLYYYASDWQLLNEFVIGTIQILKALYISPELITIQANTTKWTLERGKPFCRVKHATTDMTYTLKGNYDHDSTTLSSPVSNTDVTMSTQNYASIYNTSDQYRLLIIKQDPTTIKTDKIPSDTITGIGVFNNNDASSYNLAPSIAKEFGTQTIQSIGLKEV